MDIPSVGTGLRCIGPQTTKLCCQCSSVRWPDNAVKRRWQRLARHVEMSGPNPIGKYLGCNHRWGNYISRRYAREFHRLLHDGRHEVLYHVVRRKDRADHAGLQQVPHSRRTADGLIQRWERPGNKVR